MGFERHGEIRSTTPEAEVRHELVKPRHIDAHAHVDGELIHLAVLGPLPEGQE